MPKTLDTFLQELAQKTELELVGPLAQKAPLTNAELVFVDGGSRFRQNNEGYSLGDNDSYTGTLDCTFPEHKDFTDLSGSLKIIPETVSCVFLNGFLGGDRAHELANFAEVHRFLKARKTPTEVRFIEGGLIRVFSPGNWRLTHQGRFSLFCLEKTHLSLLGSCTYEVERRRSFQFLSSHGVSNKAYGEMALTTTQPAFFFLDV